MRVVVIAASLVLLWLAGCSSQPPPEPQVVYVTPSPTPTGPPTYLRADVVINKVGKPYTVRFQAYALDSNGQEDYDGYSLRSVEITGAAQQTLRESEWPQCDGRMEGLRIRLFSRDGGQAELLMDRIWEGIHCTGDNPTYNLQILPDNELTFGTYYYT